MADTELNDRIIIGKLAHASLELLSMDRIWTNHLTTRSKIRPVEVPQLRHLTDGMHALVTTCEQVAVPVSEIYSTRAREVNSTVKAAEATMKLSPDQKAQFEKTFKGHPPAQVGLRAAKFTMSNAASERLGLQQKMAKISGGGFSRGDFTRGFACSLCGNALVGACMTGQPEVALGALLFAIALQC